MRQLVLTRGVPAAGKSTWIRENNLDMYALEPDIIRMMVQSPRIDIEGKKGIPQTNDGLVWKLLFEMLETRMTRGELVVIDATHSRVGQLNKYRKLAQKYRYRVMIVDFTDVPLETALKQNLQRPEHKFVPEEAIKRIHARLQTETTPGWVTTIKPDAWESVKDIKRDFSEYKSITVFGDVHSCIEPLKEFFTDNPYSEDSYYIFVGDYFDRGIQAVETFKMLHDLQKLPNTLFLTGNHEIHLKNFIDNGFSYENIKMPPPSRATFDDLKDIPQKDLKDFYQRLAQLAYFTYHGNTYVVTHGGIPCLPDLTVPTDDFIKGVGKYSESEEVDKAFVKNTDEACFQIHGHRNVFKKPVQNTERTFNVTGDAEFGGQFRALTLTPDGYSIHLIDNPVFDTALAEERNKISIPITEAPDNLLSYFSGKTGESCSKVPGHNNIFKRSTNKDIIIKDLQNGVYSVNFSRKVFQKRAWNDINTKARGLFLDSHGKIVARSYDKFFNWGERPETKSSSLIDGVKPPISAYEKENGFLGILSFHNDDWFVASKSTNKGEFADMFREVVTPYLTDSLKEYIKENNVSLVFEVMHENDPHIVEYTENCVILLDVIKNSREYQKLPYEDLCKFADTYGFMPKKLHKVFNTYEEMYNWRKYTEDCMHVYTPHVEGFVLEDSTGFQWKYKGRFYSFWKHMRGFKDRILKRKGDHAEVRKFLHTAEDFEVYNHMLTYDLDILKSKSIIDIRKDHKCLKDSKTIS